MVDALTPNSDERRGMAAILFGEVPSNLWSGGLWMGKPVSLELTPCGLRTALTRGSKTFQYPEENKLKRISWVAASESEQAQTTLLSLHAEMCARIVGWGCKAGTSQFIVRKVTKLFIRRSFWKEAPQRVIVPYLKMNNLSCFCSWVPRDTNSSGESAGTNR